MRREALDFHSICLGPFKQRHEKWEIRLSTLQKDKIEKMIVFSDENLAEGKHMEWKPIIDPRLPENPSMQG